MRKQTLVFNDIKVSKKDSYASKQAIPLNLVKANNIVISYRVKQNNDTCFENGGKNMSIKIEEESVYLKYAKIWNKIKSIVNVKFHSQPIYDDKYIKTKVKTFNNTINTLFSRDEIPKGKVHYVCIQQFVLIQY